MKVEIVLSPSELSEVVVEGVRAKHPYLEGRLGELTIRTEGRLGQSQITQATVSFHEPVQD